MLIWIICIVVDIVVLAPAIFFIFALIKSSPKGLEWIPVVITIIAAILCALCFVIYPI